MRLITVILAAGQGTRMKSAMPKALQPLAGKRMVDYAIAAAAAATGGAPVLVIGHGADQVRDAVGDRAQYAVQEQPLGSGHAVLQARDLLAGQADAVLVTYADMPLVTAQSLARLAEGHRLSGATLTLLTVELQDARDFGRIVRGTNGRIEAIVEEADCTPEPRAIREFDTGLYCIDVDWLLAYLPALPPGRGGEHCLADLVALAAAQGRRITDVRTDDAHEWLDINTRVHLAEAERILRSRISRQWMEAGVTLLDPATTYIDAEVTIGEDTTVLPNTYLLGRTAIGAHCRIGPGTMIEDCSIGDGCTVTLSVLEQAVMEEKSNIGPFGHLRKGARLCREAHMGNFGEMKNSTLGPGSKMGHFSYLGDAQVGANVNIGAGTITCNFDGEHKHPTVIEEDVFIGSDSMLVAPLHIGRGAKTGAGSVVTHDVPAGAVVYGVPARPRRPASEANTECIKE